MEEDSAGNAIFQMESRVGVLKLNMEHVLDAYFDLYWLGCQLGQFWCRILYGKMCDFLCFYRYVLLDGGSEIVLDLASNPRKCFVLLLKTRKIEWQTSAFVQCSSRLQFLRHHHEICAQMLFLEYF